MNDCCFQVKTGQSPDMHSAAVLEGDLPAFRLKALGHPVRYRIVQCLDREGECCCGDLCIELPLAQSTISQHLDMLRKAGLVHMQPDGNRSRYSLNRELFTQLADLISAFGALRTGKT
jgi:ArsR family transcriptional regulator, arsenate/arsenite/antimonite-responsive transcriptional repressor